MGGAPRRRLAVIATARPQRARLGIIRPGSAANGANLSGPEAWTTISDATPDSSDNWLSYKLMEQQRARSITPGTLTYTPASTTPEPNVAPWNSWLTPNGFQCAGSQGSSSTAPQTSKLLWLAGILGGAASLVYLMGQTKGKP